MADDQGSGGEYSGSDHGGGDEHSSGLSDHGPGHGSRPLAPEFLVDVEVPSALAYYSIDKPADFRGKLCRGFFTVLFRMSHVPFIVIPILFVYISIRGDMAILFVYKSTRDDMSEGLLSGRYIASIDTSLGGESDEGVKLKKTPLKAKMHSLIIVTLVRMGSVVSIWMVINLGVPSLKSVPLLGSRLWKWSLLVAAALLGHPTLFIFYLYTRSESQSLFSTFRGSIVEYCMKGLARSVILVQYFTTILVIWLLCVNTSNTTLHRYGSMTLVTFLVGAVLSVVKGVVLLWWKAKLIYKKYEGRILSASCQLYFLIILFTFDRLGQGWCFHPLVAWKYANNKPRAENHGRQAAEERRKILPIEEYMLVKHVGLGYIHEVATCLTNSFESTLTKDEDIQDIAPTLRQKFERPELSIFDSRFCRCLGDRDRILLQDLLEADTSKRDATYDEFEKWMVGSVKYCYVVGNRINGAFEATRLLDRVLTGLIVLVAILVWIFIMGFATTSVVVGLASIFLGLTFVFGDTCKTFFQGVIFAFVTRPFDVGDRCIIDDKKLRVKKINILTTTFFGSQSEEVVIYPNSDLSIKHIVVLLHGEQVFESKEDVMEFILPSATKALHIKSLQKNIEGYLEAHSGDYKKPYWVTFDETGEGIKMGVHFHHNLNNGDKGDQLETSAIRKDKQRSKFFLELRELLENIENED